VEVTPHAADLVSRIRGRAQGAEEELVERYTRGITLLLEHTCNDRSAAEDLCQETFRIVIEKIRNGDVREPEKLSGFVCHTAKNLAIEYYRLAARVESTDFENARQFPQAAHQLDDLLRQEEARLARKVLDGMETLRYREVLYRFYIAEEPKEQICARLQLSALHFNRILYRAKARYRTLYEEAIAHRAGKREKQQNKE
jgi:RNA polymerase sigma-70 factor, ECF subfamily